MALGIIGALIFLACLMLLIYSAVRRKKKLWWGLGIVAGFILFIVGIADRAEVPRTMKRGTHTYRHSAATSYLRNHGNIKCLQEMLGHADIQTTMKYADALGPEAMIKDHQLASPVDNLLK